MENLNDVIAKNLIKYRKHNKLTQLEIAEKLQYSDKNVSKWERGESLPDVTILKRLADFYGIAVDDFLVDKDIVDKKEQDNISRKVVKGRAFNEKQTLIVVLSVLIVWLVATVVYALFVNIDIFRNNAWWCFIYALPISFILALIFTSLWCTNLMNALAVTGLIWTSGLSFYVSVNIPESWLIFIVCIPLQLLDIFWFVLKKLEKNIVSSDEYAKRIRQKDEKKQKLELQKQKRTERKLEKKERKKQKKEEKTKRKLDKKQQRKDKLLLDK